MSKICSECSIENLSDSVFCKGCGEKLGEDINQTQANGENFSFFSDISENAISILGREHLKSYENNNIVNKNFAVLSQERAYFKGRCYTSGIFRFKGRRQEHTIDLADVTGVRYELKSLSWMFYAGLGILLLMVAVYLTALFNEDIVNKISEKNFIKYLILSIVSSVSLLVLYFQSKSAFLDIKYSGGNILFDASQFTESDSKNFIKQIEIHKKDIKIIDRQEYSQAIGASVGNVINKKEQVQNEKTQSHSAQATQSKAADLKIYADLLKDGMLTQAEFDDIKYKILNGQEV